MADTRKMKTNWSADYLFRKMGGREQAEWCSQKKAELQAETGVMWSSFHAHGKIYFNPVLKMRKVLEIHSAALERHFIEVYEAARGSFGYVGFKRIYEDSELSYPEIMGLAKTLIKFGQAVCGVDRMGEANSIKLMRNY